MNLIKFSPLLLLLAVTACNRASNSASTSAPPAAPAEKPVATVNGTPISREMYDYYVKSTTNKASSELTAEQRTQLLDNLIRGELVAQQAMKDGVDKATETASQLDLARIQILEQADVEHYLKDKKPTDAETKAEYDAQVAAMPKTQYHARHILVAATDEAKAKSIIEQLKKGAKFEDLAKKDSIDSSKDQGGDLGWFSPSNMVKPFADAVVALKKGEYTQAPVQSQFGWHVIRLDDTRETPVPPFDQVKDRVVQIVEQKKFKSYTDDLLKSAMVEKNL
ncbi:MAG: peptidylprolyl isomerase [Steroidobacterales bacterium]